MEDRLSTTKRWWIFICERFEPISTLTMITLFLIAHFVAASNLGVVALLKAVPLLLGTTLFFFKLRLYDEIKDYDTDLVINPTRPLPRGLLQHKDLFNMIVGCIVAELILFSLLGTGALIGISIAITYSLLMYKEFFIGRFIRPHLTTYAMSHTVVTVLLGLAIMAGVQNRFPLELSNNDMWFVLNNWFMFNIFEFGRKTFLSSEERENVESYSSIFGRYGAVLLVLSQALLSALCIWNMDFATNMLKLFIWFTIAVILGIGVVYANYNRGNWGKYYRAYSSGHIVVFYIGFIIFTLIG